MSDSFQRMEQVFEAFDVWERTQVCIRGHVRVVREDVERLVEQLEAADRVLAVADQLAEWCRATTSVEGVFSNNLGAQAQAQGMANLVVRYAATRESYPAKEHDA